MNTGEDIQSLRKIIDFTRLISIFILAIHFYVGCYRAFLAWGLTAGITDQIVGNVAKTGLFTGFLAAKFAALVCLIVSLVGAKGRKDEKLKLTPVCWLIGIGLTAYFASPLVLYMQLDAILLALLYILLTSLGYLLMLTGGVRLSRLIKSHLDSDIFNDLAETFPQEERLLENEYSINLPAKYRLKDKVRDSWINIINPFRGLLVAGTPVELLPLSRDLYVADLKCNFKFDLYETQSI